MLRVYIRSLPGQLRSVTTWGCYRVMTNLILEHKVLGMVFRSKVSQGTCTRVLFITVTLVTSMDESLQDVRSYTSFIILDVEP